MNHARRHFAPWLLALGAMALLLASAACGGTAVLSTEYGDDANFGAQCTVLPCPSNLGWDPVTCACDVSGDGGVAVEIADATANCSALRCPAGLISEPLGGGCACVHRLGATDATPPDEIDASVDDSDVTSYEDAYTPDVTDYDTGCGFIYDCGDGFSQNSNCQCVPCTNTCPAGESPGDNCNGCIACPYKCPQGLVSGPSCSCVPPGTTTGPADAGDGGGPTCEIAGYLQCAAGTWCALGTCPDNSTQFGCYCDETGHSTCQLECPTPPPCVIPGEGTCPYGAQCAFGSCASGGDSQLVCACYQNGSAYCSTESCDAGVPGPDSGGGNGSGVTCLLEGYLTCNAGAFCSVATCPDGTTQIGCVCNADGTATCQLECPTPPPCVIPGEGTCPFGSQCTFGTCNGGVGTILTCSCNYGSTGANCYTSSCSSQTSFDGGGVE